MKYPELDFSHLEELWWWSEYTLDGSKRKTLRDYETMKSDFQQFGYMEPEPSVEERIQRFRKWLQTREEKKILVVGHSDFFFKLSGSWLENVEFMWYTEDCESKIEHKLFD
eukprot:TRINITY_DN5138_c0_g1_i3.p1 TRINITY_DN5138_c0_g1~~TRINITY_DN5138_c0_g1_i3.p1  ORF type:complete len:111 (-),score=24.97 TRINITY_DN5138_c0_g1_i3:52-384(-)